MHRTMLAFMGTIAAGTLTSPALAEPEPRTRLVRCGEHSCLRVTGHRDDPAAVVRINGRAVAVEGERRWKVDLPLETVREWSTPNARSIEVSLDDPDVPHATSASADLPIGLLADTTNLAALVISVR